MAIGGYHGSGLFISLACPFMSDSTSASIFPLPLVAFERYMLDDDRPAYPMTYTLSLRLRGLIDRQTLIDAAEEVIARHPLLSATIDDPSNWQPCWIDSCSARPPLDWVDPASPNCCPRGEAIDLAREPGLRLWVRQTDSHADLSAQFHHACCDGIGSFGFLGELVTSYALRRWPGDNRPQLAPLDPSRLCRRGRFGRDDISWVRRAGAFGAAMAHAARFGCQRPITLAPPRPAPTNQDPAWNVHQRALDVATTRRLRAAARQSGVTVNDLLLRDMLLTISAWNDRWDGMADGNCLRILMPANLRSADDKAMPAANGVTMSFLSRRREACRDALELLRGIRQETEAVKRTRRGLRFIRVIELAQRLCGGMPRAMTNEQCFATVVLSNLGQMGKRLSPAPTNQLGQATCGDLVIESVTGAPPIRPMTSAAFLVYNYARQLIVNLRCDPRLFTTEHANALLDGYVGRIGQSANSDGDRTAPR